MTIMTTRPDPIAYMAAIESNARTYAAAFPRVMARGSGAWITDTQGRD